jgi:hypothetical protein
VYSRVSLSELNLGSFQKSASGSSAAINLYLDTPVRALDVINKICVSDLAYFHVGLDGLINYSVWQPARSMTGSSTLDANCILSLSADFTEQEHFTGVLAGYGANAKTGSSYIGFNNTTSVSIYNLKRQKTVDTYLTDQISATTLGQRLARIQGDPLALIKVKTTWSAGQMNIGDKVAISLNRGPAIGGSFSGSVFEVMGITRDFNSGTIELILSNLNQAGLAVGNWTADSAQPWNNASDQQKGAEGFWQDENGYASANDGASLNVSTWW